jgi:glycosyltransferase involved in cell wall biosynthesis
MSGLSSSREPLVSIVTPCLNAAPFIEQTLRSVLEQAYPSIDYLVMDGSSTDGTLEILDRYSARLRYVSSPDSGQADAVNRGFARTKGEILGFLNADDMYAPGAVTAAVRAFAEHPNAAVVYGEAWYIAKDGSPIAAYPVEPFDPANLARRCFICQPAAFFRRDAFRIIGGLDASLRFALDYDLWIRMARRFPMVKIDRRLAMSRVHDRTKTMSEMGPAILETIATLRRHYGYVPHNWLYGYGHHRLTGQPIAVDKPRAAFASACFSLALGARYNWRHPLRYCRDVISTARHGLA